ncbi:MAG: hypothetical protein ACK4F6_15255 [Hylemonella sp.]
MRICYAGFERAVIAIKTMTSSLSPKWTFVTRFLGPLVPAGFAGFGLWLLITGRYAYRLGRGSQNEVVLLPPDAYIAGAFFIFLAVLVAAIGMSGRRSWWFFLVGCVGAILSFAFEAWRQLSGVAVYG